MVISVLVLIILLFYISRIGDNRDRLNHPSALGFTVGDRVEKEL